MEYLEKIAVLLNGIDMRLTTIEGSIGCVKGERHFSFWCDRLNLRTTGLTCMRLRGNNCASCMGCRKGFDAIRDLTVLRDKKKEYRANWEHKVWAKKWAGAKGHGGWNVDREFVESWAKHWDSMYPDTKHWIEEREVK